jgi:hypothetical protein
VGNWSTDLFKYMSSQLKSCVFLIWIVPFICQ